MLRFGTSQGYEIIHADINNCHVSSFYIVLFHRPSTLLSAIGDFESLDILRINHFPYVLVSKHKHFSLGKLLVIKNAQVYKSITVMKIRIGCKEKNNISPNSPVFRFYK
jgi:hypothetical protein